MIPILTLLCFSTFISVESYKKLQYTIMEDEGAFTGYKCYSFERYSQHKGPVSYLRSSLRPPPHTHHTPIRTESAIIHKADPVEAMQAYLHKFLFGPNVEKDDGPYKDVDNDSLLLVGNINSTQRFKHYVSGSLWRAELFNNKSGVHLPIEEYMHRGHCELKITNDFMQTAVDAFAIFMHGTLADIERLPADYVLRSVRTIAMMRIAREKLVATWEVVKAGKPTIEISHQTLEMYRPLFKYINGREMARLNLSDERIVTYIGTYPELDRHQVGVVAGKYTEINRNWALPKYLNLMNNLLCGVPMTFMRKIPENTYLQLSHQALGKSYSWSARDVSRLGLLLAEVEGEDLSLIKPEAISGITAQVMMLMLPQNLQHLTEIQVRYLAQKPLNILARKLKKYQDNLQQYGCGYRTYPILWFLSLQTLLLSSVM